MLVIETHISLNDLGEKIDHQSRIVVVECWNEYVKMYITNNPRNLRGSMIGLPFRKDEKIENLKYDNYHLSCELFGKKFNTLKYVYKLQEELELKVNNSKLKKEEV